MNFPLSRREWKLYEELKNSFINNKKQIFELSLYHRYEDWLILLTERGVLSKTRIDGGVIYCLRSSFEDFDAWIRDQNKKSQRPSKREWRIGIISAVIGAITGAIVPIILQYLKK